MKRVPIDDATEVQLRLFASETLGMDIKDTAKIDTVRARVLAAWDKPEILIADTEAAPEPEASKPAAKQTEPGMVRLILGVTEEAGGADPVQVGVNGKVMLVPRGKEVEIPLAYFQVLENAVQFKYEPLPDGGMEPEPRKVPLYPFQRLDAVAA